VSGSFVGACPGVAEDRRERGDGKRPTTGGDELSVTLGGPGW
jgi:hypothetical protein